MKRLLPLFLLIAFTAPLRAQYCNTLQGNKLHYKIWDSEYKAAYTDTILIADVYTKDDTLVVRQKNLSTNEDPDISFHYSKDGATFVNLIDSQSFSKIVEQYITNLASKDTLSREKKEKIRKKQHASGNIRIPLYPQANNKNDFPETMFEYKFGPIKMKITADQGICEGKETITTAAGTFECLKVTYRLRYKMMFLSETSFFTEWYAEKIGLVKSVETNKKGRMESSKELLKIDL